MVQIKVQWLLLVEAVLNGLSASQNYGKSLSLYT